MITEDIRVSIMIFENRKIRRLMKEFGDAGLVKLLRLWTYAAKNRPKGILYDMDHEDLTEVMGFVLNSHLGTAESENEQCSKLISAMLNLKLLEKDDSGTISIHDWREHNGYVFFAPERSEQARKAALTRHHKKGSPQKTNGQCSKGERAMLNAKSSNAPLPYPSPMDMGGGISALDGAGNSPPKEQDNRGRRVFDKDGKLLGHEKEMAWGTAMYDDKGNFEGYAGKAFEPPKQTP